MLMQKLLLFIGANLSEERFFPEPLSKDFQYYGVSYTGHMSCIRYAKTPQSFRKGV